MRSATLSDVHQIAAIHVQSWHETYTDLLPASEIARQDVASRAALWQAAIASGRTRITLIPGCGFAAMGPQRGAAFMTTHPDELYALYVLRAHQGKGLGKALLATTRSNAAFTAWVLAGNTRAEAFYSRIGGTELRRATETLDGVALTDILLSFPNLSDIP